MTVNIRKFRIIVLVSNRIEYWSNYSIRNFEYSHSTSRIYAKSSIPCTRPILCAIINITQLSGQCFQPSTPACVIFYFIFLWSAWTTVVLGWCGLLKNLIDFSGKYRGFDLDFWLPWCRPYRPNWKNAYRRLCQTQVWPIHELSHTHFQSLTHI